MQIWAGDMGGEKVRSTSPILRVVGVLGVGLCSVLFPWILVVLSQYPLP